MFTKPASDDNPSTIVGIVDAGATRVSAIERVAGIKLTGGSIAMAALPAVFVIRVLVSLSSFHGSSSIRLSASVFILGYGVIFGLGWWQRQREKAGHPYVFDDAESAGIGTHLVRKVMWLLGRWWGRVLLAMFWPFIYASSFSLIYSSLPVLIGAGAFLILWTMGNRLLRS